MSEVGTLRSKRLKTGGRKKGSPNIVTRDVRQAIAAFVEGNVHKLQEWLETIASADPAKAADLFIRILEYHIPKLRAAMVEVRSQLPKPVRQMTFAELQAIVSEAEDRQPARMISHEECDGEEHH